MMVLLLTKQAQQEHIIGLRKNKGEKMVFTFSEIIAFVVGALGLMLTVLNILDKQATLKMRADEPMEKLKIRLESLEQWQLNVNRRLDEGDRHFEKADDANKIIQQSLLALMDDALSENGKRDELQKARDNLFSYLSQK